MLIESSTMATKLREDEDDVDVELELCLSLGGPFNKTDKSKQVDMYTDGETNAVNCTEGNDVNVDGGTTRTKETRKKQEGLGQGDYKYKRFKTESNGVTNAVYLTFNNMDNIKPGTIGSPICQEGENYDFGASSGPTKPVTEETDKSKDGLVETKKPPKPRHNSNGDVVKDYSPLFDKMPCVTSTGNGPEGKTVNGFLYRYSKTEISIICVCHGTFFSPAEFIIHAGGSHVSHPLRHITVVPSSF
ncbi:unnamed protein product [Cochlearia groenlandica]